MNCASCNTTLDSRTTFCQNCGATVPDPHLGAEIGGRYVPDRRIAIGGFGSIYSGREVGSGRTIALKIMHRELAGDERLVARFRREGLVLRKLLNPHAVATYELGETEEALPYIAMELLEGDTLLGTTQAAGGKLPWPRAFAIGIGVCSALTEAHGLGIVHRDLKPANIFVTANDSQGPGTAEADFVKVLDFGIAKILSNSEVSDPRELTIMGVAVGTVEYMAPEQLMGGRADPRTDLYTLGVVLYEVITGHRPYPTAGLDLLTDQLSGPPPAPSTHVDVPPDVDAILLRCLADDLDDRFASAADLSRALDEALALAAAPSAASTAAAPPRAAPPQPVAPPQPATPPQPAAPPRPAVPPPQPPASLLPTPPALLLPLDPPLYEPPTSLRPSRAPLVVGLLVVVAAVIAAVALLS